MRMGMCAYPYFCCGKIYIKEIMNQSTFEKNYVAF